MYFDTVWWVFRHWQDDNDILIDLVQKLFDINVQFIGAISNVNIWFLRWRILEYYISQIFVMIDENRRETSDFKYFVFTRGPSS